MKNENAPMTQTQFEKLHALLVKMRSENENNYNELRDDNREINQKLDSLQENVETIAENTSVTLKRKAS